MSLKPFNIAAANFDDAPSNYKPSTIVQINKVTGGVATLYADAGGLTQIPQDGSANRTDSSGMFSCWIAEGDYTVTISGVTKYFYVGGGTGGGIAEVDTLELINYYSASEDNHSLAVTRMLADGAFKDIRKFSLQRLPQALEKWVFKTPNTMPSGTQWDFGFTKFDWGNTDTNADYRRKAGIFQAIGTESATVAQITGDLFDGDYTVNVNSVAGFEVGGFVRLQVTQTGDQTAGMFVDVDMTYQIADIDTTNNIIYLDAPFGWDITNAEMTGSKSATYIAASQIARDIVIKNVDFEDTSMFATVADPLNNVQPNYVIGAFYFETCHNIQIESGKAYRSKCPFVQFYKFHKCSVKNLSLRKPDAYSAGEGYTVQFSRGTQAYAERVTGERERHTVDFTCVGFGYAKQCQSAKRRGTASFLCHGRFEHDILFEDCVGDDFSYGAGFTEFGNWNKRVDFVRCNIGTYSGRCLDTHFTRCEIETINSFRIGKATFVDTKMPFGFVCDVETRFAAQGRAIPDDWGLYVLGNSRLRTGTISNLQKVSVADDVQIFGASDQTAQIVYTNIKDYSCGRVNIKHCGITHTGTFNSISYADGTVIDNDISYMTSYNGSANIQFSSLAKFGADNPTISIGGITHSCFVGTTSYPLRFRDAATQFSYNLTLREQVVLKSNNSLEFLVSATAPIPIGTISGCNLPANKTIRFTDGTNQVATPATVRVYGNYYATPANSIDETSPQAWSGTISAGFASTIAANSESRVVINTSVPANFRGTGFVGVVNVNARPNSINFGIHFDDSSNEWKVYAQNTSTASVAVGTRVCKVMIFKM